MFRPTLPARTKYSLYSAGIQQPPSLSSGLCTACHCHTSYPNFFIVDLHHAVCPCPIPAPPLKTHAHTCGRIYCINLVYHKYHNTPHPSYSTHQVEPVPPQKTKKKNTTVKNEPINDENYRGLHRPITHTYSVTVLSTNIVGQHILTYFHIV